jgi:hypothetical protein
MTSSPKPTVDLGYPTEPHGRVPSFNTIEEEAEFWDTHDLTDFDAEFGPWKNLFDPSNDDRREAHTDEA